MDIPSKSGPLKLLASVERISELEQSAVILRDLVGQMPRGVELTESKLVMAAHETHTHNQTRLNQLTAAVKK